MTIEYAISILDPETRGDALSECENVGRRMGLVNEACEMICSILRAKYGKLDRSKWNGCEHCDIEWEPKEFWNDDYEYSSHEFRIDDDSILYHDSKFGWEGVKIKFCPFCGCPLTKEAWEELERKIGGL